MIHWRKQILCTCLLFSLLPSKSAGQFDFTVLPCTVTSVGITPLNDLGPGIYQGYQGGLYPGGINTRPAGHDSAGRQMAAGVVPRDGNGQVDLVNGRIVLLSIGMSNATQEFSVFRNLANADSSKNPKLTIVDGAQGGQTAAVISDSNANFWNVIDQRLTTAGVTRQQVQAAWVKEANANPTQQFPVHARILDSQFVLIARILKGKYPNIRLAYWSSRIYAGYANTTLNPEPYAYESGFAVKWLITRQINGDTLLTFSGPQARSPWLAWGPYLWADGLMPRSDSLIWLCTDFQSDGTHPSTSGRTKVAQMLLTFFKSDTTTTGWFLRPPPTSVRDGDGSRPETFFLGQNYPNPFNPTTTIKFEIPSASMVKISVYNTLGQQVKEIVHEELPRGFHERTVDAAELASGVYFYTFEAHAVGSTSVVRLWRKMVVLR